MPECQQAFAVELVLEDPAFAREVLVGQRRKHRWAPGRKGSPPQAVPQGGRQPVENAAQASCAAVRPEMTERRLLFTGLRRRSARSSAFLTSSHRSRLPLARRVSANAPESFSPSSQTVAWP